MVINHFKMRSNIISYNLSGEQQGDAGRGCVQGQQKGGPVPCTPVGEGVHPGLWLRSSTCTSM